eukprot:CAMPEP_0195284326 /NCGR_PEP_ID=MMETSP0707-20130614/2561_1 /TAXON_ID=33640 /ORGANISM="Asterionellopsis glacialis, Strain CCMP134" /LENGTH=269 /DNA_ID=CAMNT_0040343653 /DNA_START=192 /DNA_END=1001 /DNA_ORIENTATION=+
MSLQHLNPHQDEEFSSMTTTVQSSSPIQRTRKTHSIRRSSIETEDQEILAKYSPTATAAATSVPTHYQYDNRQQQQQQQQQRQQQQQQQQQNHGCQNHHHHHHHRRQESEDSGILLKAIEAYEALEEEAAKSEACYPLEEDELSFEKIEDDNDLNSVYSNLSNNNVSADQDLFDFFEDYSRDSPPEKPPQEKTIIHEVVVCATPNLERVSTKTNSPQRMPKTTATTTGPVPNNESATASFPVNDFNSMQISSTTRKNNSKNPCPPTAME